MGHLQSVGIGIGKTVHSFDVLIGTARRLREGRPKWVKARGSRETETNFFFVEIPNQIGNRELHNSKI